MSLALLLPLPKLNPTVDMEGLEDTEVVMEDTEARGRLNLIVDMADMEDAEVDMEDTEARERLMLRLRLPL